MNRYLARLHERAIEAGWRCLSQEWLGAKARYLFECANEHRIERVGRDFSAASARCEQCEADTIERRVMSNVAQQGGILLETFKGLRERHRVRCGKGHEWDAQGVALGRGYWCPHCKYENVAQSLLRPDGLFQLQTMAAAKGGRCLSDTYMGHKGYHAFECALGHRWETRGNQIWNERWCPQCANERRGAAASRAHFYQDGLERLRATADRQGGQCLSNEYTGSEDRYRFRCAKGHEWTQKAREIWGGSWCPRCYDIARRVSIEELQAIAASRGGKCVSPEVLGWNVKLEWECYLGHVWMTTPSTVKQGAWCPNCAILRRTLNPRKRKRYDVDG